MKNLCFLFLVIIFASCSSTPKVQRVDSSTQVDLSGYWNDTDARLASKSLIDQALESQRIAELIAEKKNVRPVVLVGSIKNETDEHIDAEIIAREIESAIFNSGKLDFVAGGDSRSQLRAERADQQVNASEATAAKLGAEIGADLLLSGTLRTIIDKASNQEVRTYWIYVQMHDISTGKLRWEGRSTDIKKVVTRPKGKL